LYEKAYGLCIWWWTFLRDYIYIDDVVAALLCLDIADRQQGGLNVANGIGTTLKAVFEIIVGEVVESTRISANIINTD